jgi:hypothetical protein
VKARRNSQQSDLISDKPTNIFTESDFLSFGEPNSEAAPDTDYQINIFLDKSLVEDIMLTVASTFNNTLFGSKSQVQPDADY